MLFDLRASGRRRTVKVVYVTLAVLMAAGLILFGVGGAVGGGLLDSFSGNGSSSGSDQLAKQARTLQRRIRANPTNGHLWAELAKVQYEDATSGDNYDSTTGAFTKDGATTLKASIASWDKYIASSPAKPDANIASLMVTGLAATGHYLKAMHAAEIVASSQPSSGTYQQLATYAYYAGQTGKGDLAAAKAVSLAPKASRNAVKTQIAEAKTQAQAQTAAATAATTTAG